MEYEVWYPVKDYKGYYEITKTGMVRSLSKRNFQYILEGRIDRGGYKTVRLSKSGNTKTHFVHRLLAQQFILNPLNKGFVNHKNGIKLDNSLSNLEWVSHQENVIDAYKQGLNSFAKKLYDPATGITYHSIKAAAKATGINYNTCCKRLKRKSSARLRYAG